MEVQGFRIGNLINKSIKSGNGRIISSKLSIPDLIRIDDGSGQINYNPIPLTEDWLVKLGFSRGSNPRNIEKYPVQLLDSPNGFEYFYGYGYGGKFLVVKYVHQLQNLYFALTGTELTLQK